MNIPLLITLTLTGLLMAPLSSCGDDASAKVLDNDARQAVDDASEWSEERWNDFVDSTETQVDQLENKLDELRAEAERRGESLPADLQENMDTMKGNLAELRDASADHFEKLSVEASEALDAAGERLDQAWKALKGDG